jgi:NADPH:quinone reductase-like Zn-dependent oxidoreductase
MKSGRENTVAFNSWHGGHHFAPQYRNTGLLWARAAANADSTLPLYQAMAGSTDAVAGAGAGALAAVTASDAAGGLALCCLQPAATSPISSVRVERESNVTTCREILMSVFYAPAGSGTIRANAALAILACISLVSCATAPPLPVTQQQYQFVRSGTQGPFTMQLVEVPVPQPGAHQVLIRVHATSLNRRDVFELHGQYPVGPRQTVVPLSDGAGEVVATGSGVTRFHVGDRVAGIFFQNWASGRPPPDMAQSALGGFIDGMLSQYVALDESGVVTIPTTLTYEEAATLPCAGVTAWNGLFKVGQLQPGDYVLLEGTGGVSMLGLSLAVAQGAKAIVTSSHDEKLVRAKALGAIGGVNYRTTTDWEKPVRALTGGAGVQDILEVGGKDSLPHALATLGPGGHVALIGGLGGFGGNVPTMALMTANITATGIYVGSRADFEALNAFIDAHHVKPVVDRVFQFKDAPAAFAAMDDGESFGKIVIRVTVP